MALKYKVGDRVRIKSLDWYYNNRDRIDEVACGNTNFIPDMVKYCEEIVTISSVLPTLEVYHIKEDGGMFNWTDEMIEGLVEEEPNDCEKCGLIRNSTRCLFMDNCPLNRQKNIIEIPEDYVIKDENGNVINTTKIILEKKKKEYPKTFLGCCDVLGIEDIISRGVNGYRSELLDAFQKLLICRDAYWEIAGEEMGLETPWEPDYTNEGEKKFSIWVDFGEIKLGGPFTTTQMVLSLPTKEMRDAFYENFKYEIEICKELL